MTTFKDSRVSKINIYQINFGGSDRYFAITLSQYIMNSNNDAAVVREAIAYELRSYFHLKEYITP